MLCQCRLCVTVTATSLLCQCCAMSVYTMSMATTRQPCLHTPSHTRAPHTVACDTGTQPGYTNGSWVLTICQNSGRAYRTCVVYASTPLSISCICEHALSCGSQDSRRADCCPAARGSEAGHRPIQMLPRFSRVLSSPCQMRGNLRGCIVQLFNLT